MTYLGKEIKDKHLTKIKDYLNSWLDSDEEIIAVFMASNTKMNTGSLVLTNRRVLTTTSVFTFSKIALTSELVADDIHEFIAEKGFGRGMKLSVVKKNNDKQLIGTMYKEDTTTVNNFLSRMSGSPKSVQEKMNIAKNDEEDARKQAAIIKANNDQIKKESLEKEQQAAKESAHTAKQERKVAESARIEARGKKLGYVFVKYVGGHNPQDKKTFFEGRLNCYENEVEYKDRGIAIPANQVVSFEITGKEQTSTTSRLTVTRMVTLGIFSLAAPKHKTKTKREASIYIGLRDGRRLLFQSNSLTEFEVHKKLASAISRYSSLQSKQDSHQQAAPTQTLDVAGEIARFADLQKQGILTDDEFEAKKKQLLNL